VNPTLKYFIDRAIVVALLAAAFFFVMNRLAPAPVPVHAPVVVFSPSPPEHEVQAVIDALKTVAESKSGVSVLEQPAVSVIRDSGMVKGLTDAQIAQLLAALKPKAVEKVGVTSALVGPSPQPYTGQYTQVYQAAYDADTKALRDTTIKTNVTITRQEVQPSRIGSMIASGGTGISLAVMRRGQYEADLGLLQPNSGSHLVGAAALTYLIPHTSLSIGPSITYQHGVKYGISAIVHF